MPEKKVYLPVISSQPLSNPCFHLAQRFYTENINRHVFISPSALTQHFKSNPYLKGYVEFSLDIGERRFDDSGKLHWPSPLRLPASYKLHALLEYEQSQLATHSCTR